MADEKKDGEETKEYAVEGSADVTGTEGDKHKVAFEGQAEVTSEAASVTDISPQPVKRKMVEVFEDGREVHTPMDLEDPTVQARATADAARDTAKVAVGAASPAAFTRSGRVD